MYSLVGTGVEPVSQRWAAVGPLTRQLPLPISLSHSVPSVVKETARRYEGCYDGLAVLASSRLASRGIPDNADESGRTPSLRVSDFAQRCRIANRALIPSVRFSLLSGRRGERDGTLRVRGGRARQARALRWNRDCSTHARDGQIVRHGTSLFCDLGELAKFPNLL